MVHPLLGIAALAGAAALVFGDEKPKRRRRATSWQKYERDSCASLGAEHVGGPGRSDCAGPGFTAEVKHHKRKVGSPTIERAYERGDSVVVSSSGFTSPAVQRAAELGVALKHRKLRATSR